MRIVPSPNRTGRTRRRGFTLIETSVAIVIIATAVTAMCELLTTGTAVNVAGNELTTGVNLAGSIHEMAIGLPFNDSRQTFVGQYRDIWDLDGAMFSPPIDACRAPISFAAGWVQQVSVQSVDNQSIGNAVAKDRAGPTAQLVVTVSHNGRFVYTGRWLIVNASP